MYYMAGRRNPYYELAVNLSRRFAGRVSAARCGHRTCLRVGSSPRRAVGSRAEWSAVVRAWRRV